MEEQNNYNRTITIGTDNKGLDTLFKHFERNNRITLLTHKAKKEFQNGIDIPYNIKGNEVILSPIELERDQEKILQGNFNSIFVATYGFSQLKKDYSSNDKIIEKIRRQIDPFTFIPTIIGISSDSADSIIRNYESRQHKIYDALTKETDRGHTYGLSFQDKSDLLDLLIGKGNLDSKTRLLFSQQIPDNIVMDYNTKNRKRQKNYMYGQNKI
ncbi:hypothetical protein C0585_04445 [Candidatus Woesearchaeota archaeon]|nr:MAG: hypothetical protein C0585_04445 [Candidatus Woesearchaeota archaeon]